MRIFILLLFTFFSPLFSVAAKIETPINANWALETTHSQLERSVRSSKIESPDVQKVAKFILGIYKTDEDNKFFWSIAGKFRSKPNIKTWVENETIVMESPGIGIVRISELDFISQSFKINGTSLSFNPRAGLEAFSKRLASILSPKKSAKIGILDYVISTADAQELSGLQYGIRMGVWMFVFQTAFDVGKAIYNKYATMEELKVILAKCKNRDDGVAYEQSDFYSFLMKFKMDHKDVYETKVKQGAEKLDITKIDCDAYVNEHAAWYQMTSATKQACHLVQDITFCNQDYSNGKRRGDTQKSNENAETGVPGSG